MVDNTWPVNFPLTKSFGCKCLSLASDGQFSRVGSGQGTGFSREAPSVESIKGFMANPELKAAMVKGGVIGIPDVNIPYKI